MGALSQLEADTIAHWFNRTARALNLAAAQPGLTLDRIGRLTALADSLADDAANLSTQYAQIAFADADRAFSDISAAASAADAAARRLSSDIRNVETVLNIGAKLVALGAASLAGDYGAALSDLIALVGPTTGSGDVASADA